MSLPRPPAECPPRAALLLAALLLAALPAQALLKHVDPDGRVTYTDRPPPDPAGSVKALAGPVGAGADEVAALPYALREPAQRFPVTLYTMQDCGEPCTLARALLARRGVPYAEHLASRNDEREAWPERVGGLEAPVLKVGQQALRGYVSAAWEEALDTAGYPRQSQLPASYRPRVRPLIEDHTPPAPKTPPTPAPVDPASNPAGIRF